MIDDHTITTSLLVASFNRYNKINDRVIKMKSIFGLYQEGDKQATIYHNLDTMTYEIRFITIGRNDLHPNIETLFDARKMVFNWFQNINNGMVI